MSDSWFAADLHLNHEYMVGINPDGDIYRPEFKNVNDMNEKIIDNINKLVRPKDKLYLLGDVAFKPASSEDLIRSINGRKYLIMGNHDEIREKTKYYTKVYNEICMWKKFKDYGFICTHVPLRTDGIRDVILNVHGHIHRAKLPEPCYYNVSIENTEYKPVHFDQILSKVQEVAKLIVDGVWKPPPSIAH